MWADLMGSNYENYALLKEDDPYEECVQWFWLSLNEDDVYPQEFLEELIQMCEDIDSGKVKTYSISEVMMNELEELIGDVEVDLKEKFAAFEKANALAYAVRHTTK
jgi:hypothetical protein